MTPLLSEVLESVAKAKTKDKKVALLRKHDSQGLRRVLKSSFDPNIVWKLPDGPVPYEENDAPAGTEHTRLEKLSKSLYHYIERGNPKLKQTQRETMFIQLLEGLHADEAKLLVNAKDKRLHQIYKGLSSNVVKEAFGWNDNYMQPKKWLFLKVN